MLIRPHDDCVDVERARQFLVDQGFGHFAASGRGHQIPVVVPTQFVLHDGAVVFHLSASNPVFERLQEQPWAVLSVAGDWAYIPSAWKAIGGEDPRYGVPTTYYGAVQVAGEVDVVESAVEVADVLRAQLRVLEPEGEAVDPSEHGPKLRAIRGIRLAMTDVRAKFKYGGNVDAAHRAAIARRLEQRGAPGDAAAIRHLSRT